MICNASAPPGKGAYRKEIRTITKFIIEMKKLIFTLFVALCTVGISAAQDLEKATELFNNAATLLNDGNKTEALDAFNSALTTAEALGEEGAEIAGKCKDIIPNLMLSVSKDLVKANDMDNAVASLKKAAEVAKAFGAVEVEEEANSLIPDILMKNAGSLLNAKDFAGAAAAYKAVTDLQPANGMAWLRMGMALAQAGQTDEAVAAFTSAVENGQDAAANKQLSNLFVKKAAACQKAKDMKGALENAQKSVEYLDNPTAQKLIGLSALSLKQNKTAAEGFEAYLSQSPNAADKAQITYQLGTALVAAGDNAKACGYFKQIKDDAKWGEAARYQITTLKCN
jgi:Uncharacterized protein conserved in bacteria